MTMFRCVIVSCLVICSVAQDYTLVVNITDPGILKPRKLLLNSNEASFLFFAEHWDVRNYYVCLHLITCEDKFKEIVFLDTDVPVQIVPYDERLSFYNETHYVPEVYTFEFKKTVPKCSDEWTCKFYVRKNLVNYPEIKSYWLNLEVEIAENVNTYSNCKNKGSIFDFLEKTRTWMIASAVAFAVILIQILVIWILCKKVRKPGRSPLDRESPYLSVSFEEIPQRDTRQHLPPNLRPSALEPDDDLYTVPYSHWQRPQLNTNPPGSRPTQPPIPKPRPRQLKK